ncbi:hypothetical protein FQZ97_968000 [compost metagenome]
MPGQGLRHAGLHVVGAAHVAIHIERVELVRQRFAAQVVHVGDDHVGALAGEAPGAGFTNALRATGDDDDAALVAEVNGVEGGGQGLGLGVHAPHGSQLGAAIGGAAMTGREAAQPTFTPFQKATRPRMCSASGLGSG